jgi:hypothetical protein
MLFGCLMVVLDACSGGSSRAGSTMPIAHGEAHGSGTDLAFGLQVPSGAKLIGPVLPGSWAESDDGSDQASQTAFLSIDGKPYPVVRDIFRQAKAKSFDGNLTCSSQAGTLFCQGELYRDGVRHGAAPSARQVQCVNVELAYGDSYGRPSSALALRFHPEASQCSPLTNSALDLSEATPQPPHFGKLARVGDSVLDGYFSPLRVQAGSVVVAKPVPYLTLLRVDQDPDRVIAAYLAAVPKIEPPYYAKIIATPEETRLGWHVRSWRATDQEGDRITIESLRQDAHTYLIVHELLG